MESFDDFNNPQVAGLPTHLRQFIVDQRYDLYTPVDHAVWRYVMRQNYSYLKDVAYYPYIPGLEKAGLAIEHIPDLQQMNDALGKIGWGAVTVDGFIPPVAFMEYQAYRVLVIAAGIRSLKHIEYTPAPDIIHESAGHAPIIADYDYHQYLSYFGSIGSKAMISVRDFELYEAIRALSILKETPDANLNKIEEAESLVNYLQQNMGEPSEMALLSRLHWWTVEYGLIGTLGNPKIYGAGLLSSIGESASCMQPSVTKLWYNIDTLNYAYDITQPQPQLFVTPTFQNLIDVLNQFADTMSFRIGGEYGLQKAAKSKAVCTAVYSSGLQVSGVFSDTSTGFFIKTIGPTALAVNNKQLEGHGKTFHADGFSSPAGLLQGFSTPLENFTNSQLQAAGLIAGNYAKLVFDSGISVAGRVNRLFSNNGKLQLITLNQCTVTDKEQNILFDPSWGVYDMAIGEKIISVFCGAADKAAYGGLIGPSKKRHQPVAYSSQELALQQLYQQVKKARTDNAGISMIEPLWRELKHNNYPDVWLCALEMLELIENTHSALASEIRDFLEQKAVSEPELNKLITDGLSLINHADEIL